MVGRCVIGRSRCAAFLALSVVAGATLGAPVPADAGSNADGTSTAGTRTPDSQRPLGAPKPSANQPAAPAPGPAGPNALKTVVSLGGVLALVMGTAFLLKRMARAHGGLLGAAGPGGRAPAGVLEILGRYPLSRGQTLILLKLDRRVLLLSQAAGGRFGNASLTTLCEITEPDEIASILVKVRDDEGESMARRFQSVLGSADRAAGTVIAEAGAGRQTTIGPGGDRAELWAQPESPHAQGFALLQSDRACTQRRPETGAESLRRRLGSLRRLGDGGEGAEP